MTIKYKNKEIGLISMPEINLLNNEKTDLYKQAIESAINTYPLEWRVILETLQNSMDAIDKNDKISEGQIDITFDIVENKVTIQDNGIGFPLKEDLFFLHGGTKTNDLKSKGKIGVGLKVTIFSSKTFYIKSVFRQEGKIKTWNGEVKDAYRYKEKKSLNAEMSDLQDTKFPTGTIVTYSFPDDSVLDFIKITSNKVSNIDDIIERALIDKFKKSIEHFFRTNSYSADTRRLINESSSKKIKINITIKYSKIPLGLDKNLSAMLKDANGKIEFSFYNKFWDVEEVISKQKKGVNRLKIIDYKFYDKACQEYGKFDADKIIWIKKFEDKKEIRDLLPKKYKDEFENLIKKINGLYLALGTVSNMKKFYLKQPDTFISINGVPSDHNLPNPTSNTAYANLVLCILDVDSIFNYGKLQTTDRYLISQSGKFYNKIYNHAIAKIGEKAFGQNTEADTSGASVEKPVIITTLEDLGTPLSFKKIPTDENSLIAIFFELLGNGKIKNYEFYSLHAKRKYDATAMIKTDNMGNIPKPKDDSDLKYVEFKLKLSELLDEIEDGIKELKKITLIVVWEDDVSLLKENPYDYEVIDLEDSKDKDKGFYGVRKCLMNKLDGTERQIFIMKDFIKSLKE